MARLPRYFIPGCPQHIILRGNNRQAIFAADADLRFWRDCVVEAAAQFGLAIHAYVWMTNHVHLLASPGDAHSLPKTLQSRAGHRCIDARVRLPGAMAQRSGRRSAEHDPIEYSQGLGAGGFALCARGRGTGAAQGSLARAGSTSERPGVRG